MYAKLQLAGTIGWMSDRVLPTPWQVLAAVYRLTLSGELTRHLAVSFQRASIGFLLGGTIGCSLGIAVGASKAFELFIDSTIQMLRSLPHLALIPLVIVWFGIGESAKIFLVAIGLVFPVYINSFHGIASDQDWSHQWVTESRSKPLVSIGGLEQFAFWKT